MQKTQRFLVKMTLRSLPSVQISIKIYQVSLLEAVLNQTIAEPLRTRKYFNFYLYLIFHLFLCKTKSSNFLVFSVMVRSDNIAIELIKQRKKNRINIFFFSSDGSRLSFSLKYTETQRESRISSTSVLYAVL